MNGKQATLLQCIKKGNKCDPSNYRPISLTSIICKLMESIIRDHIMNFFFEKSYFSNKQYAVTMPPKKFVGTIRRFAK